MEIHLFKVVQQVGDSVQIGLFLGLHLAVPVVFDGIVGPAGEVLGDRGPLVAEGHHSQGQDPIFLIAPGVLHDAVSEMVVPPLSALLAPAVFKIPGHFRPASGAVHPDHLAQQTILLLSPNPFPDLPVRLLSRLQLLRR